MTYKRFRLEFVEGSCKIFRILDNGNALTDFEILDTLNELNDENEQLKSELKSLRKKYNDFSDAVDKRLEELME